MSSKCATSCILGDGARMIRQLVFRLPNKLTVTHGEQVEGLLLHLKPVLCSVEHSLLTKICSEVAVAITCGDVLVDGCERTISAAQIINETRAIPLGNMLEPLDGDSLIVIIGADFYSREYRELSLIHISEPTRPY